MAEYDDVAFDAMKKVTKDKSSDLFTESEYNAFATDKDRKGYDTEAFQILRKMYTADSAKNEFKNIDFNKYLDLLKPSLFKERVLTPAGPNPRPHRGEFPREERAGNFFLDIYEGDYDQFKASALRGMEAGGQRPGVEY